MKSIFWPRLAPPALSFINLPVLPLVLLNDLQFNKCNTASLSTPHLHMTVPLLEILFCLANFYLFLNSFLYVISLDIFLLIFLRPNGVALQWLPKSVFCVCFYSSAYQVVLQLLVFCCLISYSTYSYRARPSILSCCIPNSLNN